MKKQELVLIKNNEVYTTSLIIAEKLEIRNHRDLIKTIEKVILQNEKEKQHGDGRVVFSQEYVETTFTNKMNQTFKMYLLNEPAFIKVIMNLSKYKKARNIQDEFIDSFFKMKQAIAMLLLNQKNEAWLESREQGKLSRREETDTIKEFVEYAEKQGSTQASRYYGNISKMENAALFFLEQKFPNVREALTGQQLHIISTADIAVAQALKDGMERGLHYKDIYKLAKERIATIASVIPKTIVPMTELKLIS